MKHCGGLHKAWALVALTWQCRRDINLQESMHFASARPCGFTSPGFREIACLTCVEFLADKEMLDYQCYLGVAT